MVKTVFASIIAVAATANAVARAVRRGSRADAEDGGGSGSPCGESGVLTPSRSA